MCVLNTYAIIENPQKNLRQALEMQIQVVLSEGQESCWVMRVGVWLFVGETVWIVVGGLGNWRI